MSRRPAAGPPHRGAGSLPLVAIVGRPNVGKSTLFNRLVGRRQAIVDDVSGVTRDRQYAEASWEGVAFRVVDTGGFDLFSADAMAGKVRGQAAAALAEADVALFVMDATDGLTPLDEELARTVREGFRGKVLYLANKVDNRAREGLALEFYRLGVDRVYPVSAEHAIGLDEVLEEAVRGFPRGDAAAAGAGEAVRVALVGRPNVGKSSLVNAILGEERVVVDATPGTTRDAVDTPFHRAGERWVLVDTAGIRRRGRVREDLEKYSVLRSERAIGRADVCVLVLDAGELVTEQDAHIAGAIVAARTACVVVVNKWDTVDLGPKAGDQYRRVVAEGLRHLEWAPLLFASAASGRGVPKILDLARLAWEQHCRRIPTPELNALFQRILHEHQPPTRKGRPLRLGYITQAAVRPPTFAVLVNEPSRVHFTYRRYLENRIRAEYGFAGAPVVLQFRRKG